MSDSYVALLRGINLGNVNKLPMKDLIQIFVDNNCENVQNYIQSGNIVFKATPEIATSITDLITTQIQKQYGYKVPVILRTAEQLAGVMQDNPFLKKELPEDKLHVMFLANTPDADRINTLDPNRSSPDEFSVEGQEIYLHLPNGVGRSKLTNDYFETKLKTVSTARNWRTVTKLLEMARD
jgi:uncharacterized protein (DUF1697 family)